MNEPGNLIGVLMANETTPDISSQDKTTLEQITRDIFLKVMPAFVWTIFGMAFVGIIGNILTIMVYVRLGFAETIHMSYVALAFSDLCSVLTTMWCSVCYSPIIYLLFSRYRIAIDFANFTNLTGGWPHMAFSRTTALITAWISFERCLCVVFPTKVKVMITRTVTKAVLVSIFVIGCGPVVFAYIGYRLEWRVNPLNNQTMLFLSLNVDHQLNPLNTFAFLLYGAVYPVFSWVAVSICTAFLVVKLKRSAAWRRKNAHLAISERGAGGDKDQKKVSVSKNRVTKTVVIVASVFIVCSSPISVNLFLAALNREYTIRGSLRYLFMVNATLVLLLSEINSSVNVFVFTITGTKFRSALKNILARKSGKH